MMDIEHIRNLIELMEEKELLTLELSSDNDSLKLTRYYPPSAMVVSPPVQQATDVVENTPPSPSYKGKIEKSPMVGIFYSASSPDDPPFVQVGQMVQAGDQLGIIEAMKIMNPLEATQSGIVAELLIKNGEVVEFDQAIIRYQS